MIKLNHWIRSGLEYLTVFFVVLGCNSVFYVREGGNYITEIVMILSVVLAMVELHSMPLRRGILKKYAEWLLPYLCLVAVLVFVNVQKDSLVSFCGRYAVFLPMMTLVFAIFRRQGNPNRLLYVYANVVTVVSTVSLFFWIFGTMLHLVHPTGHLMGSWGGKFNYPSYYNLYFERQVDLVSGLPRNQGLFAEAPMYSLNLVFAIAAVLFLSEPTFSERIFRVRLGNSSLHMGKLNFRLVILIAALISTFSTTGIILLVAMLYGKFLLSDPRTVALRRLKYALFGILSVVAVSCAIISLARNQAPFLGPTGWMAFRRDTGYGWIPQYSVWATETT